MKFSFAMKSQTDMPDFCKEVCRFRRPESDAAVKKTDMRVVQVNCWLILMPSEVIML